MAIIVTKKMGRPSTRPDDATLAQLYKEKPTREIAEMYGVKPSTVRAWACRIRRAGAAGAEARADE